LCYLMGSPLVAKTVIWQPFRIILITLLLAHFTLGCSGKKPAGEPVALEWPEFERFEVLLLESAGLIEAGKTTEVLLRRGQLVEAGWAVSMRTLPATSNNGETLRLLLGDLVSKINYLAVPAIDSSIMSEVIIGMKPIVAEIGRASGAGGK